MITPRHATRWPQTLASLGIPNYRWVWLGQIARGTNQWAQFTAIPLIILNMGGSAFDLGVVAAVQWGPVLILGPAGGVLADRLNKRRALVLLQAVLVAQAVLLWALVHLGALTIGSALALSAVFGTANAVELPIRLAYLSELVPRAWLPNAIILQGAAFHASRMVGPATAGVLIASVGFAGTFAFCVGLAIVALLLLAAVRDTPRSTPLRDQSVISDLVEGLRYAGARADLRTPLIITLLASAFVYGVQAVLPVVATEVLSLDSRGYGALLAAMGAGAVLGAVPMAKLKAVNAGRTAAAGSAGAAASILLLGLQSSPVLAGVAMFVLGGSGLMILGSLNTMIQTVVGGVIRGRVIGLYVASFSAGVAIGGLVVGYVTTELNVQVAVVGFGLGMLAVAAWSLVIVRSGRQSAVGDS
jgi:predicted MFS family arabinose efflux permease